MGRADDVWAAPSGEPSPEGWQSWGPAGAPGWGQPPFGAGPPPPLNLASLAGLATALYVLFPLVILAAVGLLAALGHQHTVLQAIRDDPGSVRPSRR